MKKYFIFVVIILTVNLIFSLSGCARQVEIPPDLKMVEVEGEQEVLSDFFTNELVIVIHGALWDEASIQQLREIYFTLRDIKKKNLQVVVFIYDEDEVGKIKFFKESEGYKFPFFIADERVEKIFGQKNILPRVDFIGRGGNVLKHVRGYIDRETIKNLIGKFTTPPVPDKKGPRK